MSEEKPSRAETIAKSVEKVADSRGIAEIGKGIGTGLAALAAALAFASIFFGFAAFNWDGRLHPQTKCFELQEISGELFKVNTCTGDIKKVEIEETEQNEKKSE